MQCFVGGAFIKDCRSATGVCCLIWIELDHDDDDDVGEAEKELCSSMKTTLKAVVVVVVAVTIEEVVVVVVGLKPTFVIPTEKDKNCDCSCAKVNTAHRSYRLISRQR